MSPTQTPAPVNQPIKSTERLGCPLCNNIKCTILKTNCCDKSCCEQCLFPDEGDITECPFCKKICERASCALDKMMASVLALAKETASEREAMCDSINSLASVASKLAQTVKDQQSAIQRLEDKLDLLLSGVAKMRSPMT